MLSNKAKYGIRALIHMARKGPGLILIREIAEKERIPQKFLEAILCELKVAGILQSKPGKGGGYYLYRSPESINLGQVIRIIDGPLAPIPCASLTAFAPCRDCLDFEKCVIRSVMRQVRDATAQILEHINLNELVKEEDKMNSAVDCIHFEI